MMKTENEYYQQIINCQNELKNKCKNFDFKNLKFEKIENILYLENNSLLQTLQKLNFPNISIETQYNIFLIWNFILSTISNLGKEKFKETKFYNINQSFSNILLTVDGLILPKFIELNFQNILINNKLNIQNIFKLNWAKTTFKKDTIQLKIEIKPSEFHNYNFLIKYNNIQQNFTLINLYQYICFYYYIIKQLHLLYPDVNEIHIFNNIFKLIQKHSDSLTNSDLTWKLSNLQNLKESNKMNNYINDKTNINNNQVYEFVRDILLCIHQRITNIITNSILNNYKKTFPIITLNNVQYQLQDNTIIDLPNTNSGYGRLDLQYNSGLLEQNDNDNCTSIDMYINLANRLGLINLILQNEKLIIIIKNKKLTEFIIDTEQSKKIQAELYFNDAYKIYTTINQTYMQKKEQNNINLNSLLVNEFVKNYIEESFKIPTQEEKQADLIKQTFNNYNNFKQNVYQIISTSQIKNQYAIYNKKYIEQQLLHIYNKEFRKLDQTVINAVIAYPIYNNKKLLEIIYRSAWNDYYNFLNIILQTLFNVKFIIKTQIFKKLNKNYDITFIFNNQTILNNDLHKLIHINNLYMQQNSVNKLIKLTNNIIDNKKFQVDNESNTIAIQLKYEDLIYIPINIINIQNNDKFQLNLLVLDYISSFIYYCHEDEINNESYKLID